VRDEDARGSLYCARVKGGLPRACLGGDNTMPWGRWNREVVDLS
jgi:hypothetical protein